jgi:hypothetical protein
MKKSIESQISTHLPMSLNKKVVLDARERRKKSKSNRKKEMVLTIKTLKDKALIIPKMFKK